MNNIFLLQNQEEAFKIVEQMARVQCVQELDKKGFSDVFSLIGLSDNLKKAEKIKRKYFRDGEVNILFIAKNKEEISAAIDPFKKRLDKGISEEAATQTWTLFLGLILKNLFETRNELNFIHTVDYSNSKSYYSNMVIMKALEEYTLFKDKDLNPYAKIDSRFLNKFEYARDLISKEAFKEIFRNKVLTICSEKMDYWKARFDTENENEIAKQLCLEKANLILEIADPYL